MTRCARHRACARIACAARHCTPVRRRAYLTRKFCPLDRRRVGNWHRARTEPREEQKMPGCHAYPRTQKIVRILETDSQDPVQNAEGCPMAIFVETQVLLNLEFCFAVNCPSSAICAGSEWPSDAIYDPSGRACSILYGEKTRILTVRFQRSHGHAPTKSPHAKRTAPIVPLLLWPDGFEACKRGRGKKK